MSGRGWGQRGRVNWPWQQEESWRKRAELQFTGSKCLARCNTLQIYCCAPFFGLFNVIALCSMQQPHFRCAGEVFQSLHSLQTQTQFLYLLLLNLKHINVKSDKILIFIYFKERWNCDLHVLPTQHMQPLVLYSLLLDAAPLWPNIIIHWIRQLKGFKFSFFRNCWGTFENQAPVVVKTLHSLPQSHTISINPRYFA